MDEWIDTHATTFNEVILFKWVITNETTLAWAVVKLNSHFQRIPVLIKSLDVIKQVNLSIYKILNIHCFELKNFETVQKFYQRSKKLSLKNFFFWNFHGNFAKN